MTINTRQFLQALAASALTLPSTVFAETDWAHAFHDQSSPPRPFDAGFLTPLNAASLPAFGYALSADSITDNPNAGDLLEPETYEVPTLARYDETGNFLWDVRLDSAADLSGPVLEPSKENEEIFFAYAYSNDGAELRFGLFNGATADPVYVKSVTRDVQQTPNTYLTSRFEPDRFDISLDRGDAIETTVLDGAGDPIFSKNYTSPAWELAIPGVPGLSAQRGYEREFLPDQNLYLTSVAQGEVDLTSGQFTNRITFFFTNLAGEVTSSNSFTYAAGSPALQTFPQYLADEDAVLFRIFSVDPETEEAETHFVKASANGSIDWAQTITGAQFLSVVPTPDGIFAGGHRLTGDPSSDNYLRESNALVLKLDPDNGAILAQAHYSSVDEIDLVGNLFATESNVFFNIQANLLSEEESVQGNETILVRTDLDLTLNSTLAMRYRERHRGATFIPDSEGLSSFSRLLFSANGDISNEISAYTLNTDFEPILDCNNVFEAYQLQHAPDVEQSDFPVTADPVTVSDSDATVTMTDSSLPITGVSIGDRALCGPTGGATGSAVDFAVIENDVSLGFNTAEGETYSIQFSTDLEDFTEIGTVQGTGQIEEFTAQRPGTRGFYLVEPAPPNP